MTKVKLQARKQQVVKNAIYDAAIELFAARGFDETTVEEIALAAGISRRSFFRYYATKDDLLAQSVVNYGAALTDSIAAAPSNQPPLALLKETVLAGIRYSATADLTRPIIEIAQRSDSARRAYASRMSDVEDSLSAAYAIYFKSSNRNSLKPRLMANLTHSVLRASVAAWFTGECQDLSTSTKQAFGFLNSLICNSGSTYVKETVKAGKKSVSPQPSRKSAK